MVFEPSGRAFKGRWLAVIAGSNTSESHAYSSVVFVVFCVVSGLSYELITRLGDSYRVCIYLIAIRTMKMSWPTVARGVGGCV
jgi:hypothetical protein